MLCLLSIKCISDDIAHVHSTEDRDVIVLKKIYQTTKGYYYREKQGAQYSNPVKRVYLNALEEKELMMFLEKIKQLNVISNIKKI